MSLSGGGGEESPSVLAVTIQSAGPEEDQYGRQVVFPQQSPPWVLRFGALDDSYAISFPGCDTFRLGLSHANCISVSSSCRQPSLDESAPQEVSSDLSVHIPTALPLDNFD